MDSATAMMVDGQAAFAMIGQVLWVALRIGAALMAMPLIGTRAVPRRVKALLALALAAALGPLLPPTPQWDGFNAVVVLNVVREIALGVAMGFVLRLVFEAGALAGELISQGAGLSFAQMNDPLRGVNSGVVGQWFYIAFGLLFFASDGHLAFIEVVVQSYRSLPIGTPLADPVEMAAIVPGFMPSVLRAGVTLALPVMVALLAVNLAFGVLARAAPALNPIQLGLPISVLLGMVLLAMLAGELVVPIQALLGGAVDTARQVAP